MRSPILVRFVGFSFGIACAALVGHRAAQADAFVFEPVDVTSLNTDSGWLVIGPSGEPSWSYFVWDGSGYVERYATREVGTWTVQSGPPNAAWGAALAYEPGGEPRFLHEIAGATKRVRYSWQASDGRWPYEELDILPPGFYGAGAFALEFDGAGRPHAVWIRRSDNPQEEIRYGVRTAGGWSNEVVASGSYFSHAALALGPDGSPWVAYRGAGSLRIAGRTGGTWSTEVVQQGGSHVSLAVDGDGDLHLGSYDPTVGGGNTLWYATRTDGIWAFEAVDQGPGAKFHIQIELDQAGQPWIAYWIVNGGDLILARKQGGIWTALPVLSGYSGFGCSFELDAADRPWIAHQRYQSGIGYLLEVARVDEAVLAAPVVAAEGPMSVGAPFPNPTRGSLAFSLDLDRDALVRVRLVDVTGRVIAKRPPQLLGASRSVLEWTLPVRAAGTYWLEVDTGDARQARRVTLLK